MTRRRASRIWRTFAIRRRVACRNLGRIPAPRCERAADQDWGACNSSRRSSEKLEHAQLELVGGQG